MKEEKSNTKEVLLCPKKPTVTHAHTQNSKNLQQFFLQEYLFRLKSQEYDDTF